MSKHGSSLHSEDEVSKAMTRPPMAGPTSRAWLRPPKGAARTPTTAVVTVTVTVTGMEGATAAAEVTGDTVEATRHRVGTAVVMEGADTLKSPLRVLQNNSITLTRPTRPFP